MTCSQPAIAFDGACDGFDLTTDAAHARQKVFLFADSLRHGHDIDAPLPIQGARRQRQSLMP